VKIIVDNIAPFDDILRKTKKITFRLDLLDSMQYPQLQSLINEFKGQTEVKLMFNMDNRLVEVTPETTQHIEISDSFFEEARQLFGRTDFIEI
jgi:DNA polymerase-3 subunit alpha